MQRIKHELSTSKIIYFLIHDLIRKKTYLIRDHYELINPIGKGSNILCSLFRLIRTL